MEHAPIDGKRAKLNSCNWNRCKVQFSLFLYFVGHTVLRLLNEIYQETKDKSGKLDTTGKHFISSYFFLVLFNLFIFVHRWQGKDNSEELRVGSPCKFVSGHRYRNGWTKRPCICCKNGQQGNWFLPVVLVCIPIYLGLVFVKFISIVSGSVIQQFWNERSDWKQYQPRCLCSNGLPAHVL